MVRELASARRWDKVVHFFRHGESDANITPVFQSLDTPLSLQGRIQAERLGERVEKIPLDVVISSPLPRAHETAHQILKRKGIDCVISELFVERIKPAVLNGKSYDDPEADALWDRWENSLYTPGDRVEDGENFDDLIGRANDAFAFLEQRPEQSIGVVTHGYFFRVMLARVIFGDHMSGSLLRHFQTHAEMENIGMSILRYRAVPGGQGWHLWTYNDHSHER